MAVIHGHGGHTRSWRSYTVIMMAVIHGYGGHTRYRYMVFVGYLSFNCDVCVIPGVGSIIMNIVMYI